MDHDYCSTRYHVDLPYLHLWSDRRLSYTLGKDLMNDSFGLSITHPDGTVEDCYTPTAKQLEFHARTEPNVLFYGGRGSGKSMALRWEAHIRAMSTPNFKYVILRRTFPELQKSHLIFVPREMKALGGQYNMTDKIARYPNGSMGFFSHCAGEEDVLNLLGSEFYWMGVDEISTFPWEMFTKLSISVRVPSEYSKQYGIIAMVRAATNPLGPSADEINKYFIEKDVHVDDDPDYNPNDWFAVKANASDNPYLDTKQYTKRFVGLPEHVRKAWVDGDFALENALFDVMPKKWVKIDGVEQMIPYHFTNSLDIANIVKNAQIYRAIDLGWFPDPTYVLWIAHLGDRYICFHEKTLYKTIAADVAAIIKEEDQKLGIARVVNTYCDPTMSINTNVDVLTVKDIIELHGIPLEASINNRTLFASAIHSALGSEASPNVPRIQIYTKGCPYLTKALPKQRYDLKHPLELADQRDDHPAVTLAYFLISSGSMERQAHSQTKIRPWMRSKAAQAFILGSEGVR